MCEVLWLNLVCYIGPNLQCFTQKTGIRSHVTYALRVKGGGTIERGWAKGQPLSECYCSQLGMLQSIEEQSSYTGKSVRCQKFMSSLKQPVSFEYVALHHHYVLHVTSDTRPHFPVCNTESCAWHARPWIAIILWLYTQFMYMAVVSKGISLKQLAFIADMM